MKLREALPLIQPGVLGFHRVISLWKGRLKGGKGPEGDTQEDLVDPRRVEKMVISEGIPLALG